MAKPKGLTHVDPRGQAHVVDVGQKPSTHRTAEAVAIVHTTPEVAKAIGEGSVAKGDVAAVARIAAIMGAKRTSELVPLCHPLALTAVSADVSVDRKGSVTLTVRAECTGPTGVEMEAMTGASIGALTIYDMIKGMDRGAAIARVELRSKAGGRSGEWRRR